MQRHENRNGGTFLPHRLRHHGRRIEDFAEEFDNLRLILVTGAEKEAGLPMKANLFTSLRT